MTGRLGYPVGPTEAMVARCHGGDPGAASTTMGTSDDDEG
jgi:hypothetical protein